METKKEDKAVSIIEKYNEKLGIESDFFLKMPHYIISLSGDKQAIYTLYFCNPKIKKINQEGFIMNFIKNLSVDVLESVDKVVSMNKPFPILLNPDEESKNKIKRNRTGVINFGKYQNKHIDELIREDLKYVYWLKQTLEKEATIVKVRNRYTYRLSHKQQELLDNINDSLKLYYEELTDINRKNIDSIYLSEGKYENIVFEIDKIITSEKYVKVLGHKGIIYYFMYWKPDFCEIKNGDKIQISACKIKPHNEHLGVKYNYINYAKNVKII